MAKKTEKKNLIVWEDIAKKVAELCKMINNYDDPSEAAKYACIEVVGQASDTHYEALGIFTEAMMIYREISIEVMNEFDKEDNKILS
jgi:hypothetical protein